MHPAPIQNFCDGLACPTQRNWPAKKLGREWSGDQEKKRKEKIMPVLQYRHECEPINLMLVTVFHDHDAA